MRGNGKLASDERVLAAVRKVGADGWPVMVREVASASGCSISFVHEALGRLVRSGLVARHPRSERGGWRAV